MSEQTETVYANVEEATRALTSDADYSREIGQPLVGGQYERMEPANPLPREDFGEQTFEGKEGLRQAAEEVVARRTPTRDELQAIEPLEVAYRSLNGDKAGQTIKPSHEVITKEQGAHDLASFRDTLQAQDQAAADEILRQLVDGERGVQTTEALGAEPQAEQPQPIPEQPPQAADDPVAKALQDNPALLNAVQQHIAQAEQRATAQAQYYAAAVQQNAQTAMASCLAAFPEIQGLSDPSQLQTAIQVVAKSNPQRAQAMVEHIRATQNVVAEHQRVQAAQAQAYQQAAAQQWQNYSAQQDDAYDAWVSKEVTAAERTAIEAEARQMIMEEYGANAQQVAHAWQTNPTLRSFQSQKFLFAAARDRLSRKAETAARESINHKRDRTPPVVQRPGAGSAEMVSREDYGLRALSEKVSRTTGRDQIRAAAELVAARRARR